MSLRSRTVAAREPVVVIGDTSAEIATALIAVIDKILQNTDTGLSSYSKGGVQISETDIAGIVHRETMWNW